jgi:cytochrome P450
MSKAHVANLDLYEHHFKKFAALIPTNGQTFGLQDLFSKLTIDTASEFLFGESVNTLDPRQSSTTKALSEAFNYVSQAVGLRLQRGELCFLFPDNQFKKSVHLIHEYVDYFVDKAVAYRFSDEKYLEGKLEKYMCLRELAKDTGDRKVLRDQLVSILAAGLDTTAALLSLSFWLLLRHPRALQRLREEIASLDDLPPSYEELKGMAYLRWVLDESRFRSCSINTC